MHETTRRRCVIATITVDVVTEYKTDRPEEMETIAMYRRRDLALWLTRHEPDIQNAMAWCDKINIDCCLGYTEE